jgi:hypothetical protein
VRKAAITTSRIWSAGRREISEDQCAFRQAAGLRLRALAGQHQQRLAPTAAAACRSRSVAHRRRARQIDVEAAGNALEHAGLWFAAMAAGVDRVRAVEDGVDASSGRQHGAVHLVVDGIQRVHVEQAATDAGLVGRHDHPITGLIEPGDGFQAARDRSPFGRRLDELLRVVVDDAVAVEDDEFHTASFEMSATALSWSKALSGGPGGCRAAAVVDVDHHLVEEAVDLAAHRGEHLERVGVVLVGDVRLDQRGAIRTTRSKSAFSASSSSSAMSGSGRSSALLQDVADTLVGRGQRQRFGQLLELAYRCQSGGNQVDAGRPLAPARLRSRRSNGRHP